MKSEGARRLSILLGILAVAGWIVFVFVKTEGFTDVAHIPVLGWFLILAGMPICFFVAFGLVRGITWVVEGFGQDPNRK
jgi:hypothetical protein